MHPHNPVAGPELTASGLQRLGRSRRPSGKAQRYQDPLRQSLVLCWLARSSIEQFLDGAMVLQWQRTHPKERS
jgi:hypothetical protein